MFIARKSLRILVNSIRVGGFVLLILGTLGSASAQELIRIPTTAPNSGQAFVEGMLSVPADTPANQPRPAIILLHAGGG